MHVILVFTASRTTTENELLQELRNILARNYIGRPLEVRSQKNRTNEKPTFEIVLETNPDGSLSAATLMRITTALNLVKVGGFIDLVAVSFSHPALRTSSPVPIL